MILEPDPVVLTVDVPEHRLQRGDVGTVVLTHEGKGYEVEFVNLQGDTIVVISLSADQVRPVAESEIPHARSLQAT